MDKRGNLQNVGYPVFFTPGAIAKLSFICDGEVTKNRPQANKTSSKGKGLATTYGARPFRA